MSFQFRRLTLQNWLVYGDQISLDFALPEDDRNLIVFYGRNGFGKTSLLKALQFVFHGRLDREELYSYWHDNRKKDGFGELSVSIEFTFRGIIYQLTRMAAFGKWGNTFDCNPSVKLIINGRNQQDQVQEIISQIIPAETQQFVFFDGAEITRYAKRQHEDGVKDAIEQVLGIPAIRNLRDDLAKLIKELEDDQTILLKKQNTHSDLLQSKQEIEDLKASQEERKQTVTDRIKGLRDAIGKLQGEELEIRMIENDIRLLQEKEKRKVDYEERLSISNGQIDDQLKLSPLRLMVSPLYSLLQQSEAKQRSAQKRTLTLEKKRLIQEIIDEGVCICGRDIDESARDVLDKIFQRVDVLAGQETVKGDLSVSEFTQLTRILNDQRTKASAANELVERKANIIISIEEIDADLHNLKEKLKGHENTTISELYSQKANLEDRLTMEIKEQMALDIEIERAASALEDVQRKLDQSMAQTTQGEALNHTILHTRNLFKGVSEYIAQLVELKRQNIEQITTDIFLAITNKPDEYAGVHVKSDYTLQVYRKDNSVVDNEKLSAGEKEVLAYSFITALNLSTETPSPFVMDTPFGHLDAIHRHRLLDSLPRLGVQVFLLATDRDLPPNERERIEPFILQEFEIERDQNTARSLIIHAN